MPSHDHANTIRTGGCSCGALRYSISGPPIMVYACHCTNCQTLTGSAFGVVVLVRSSFFTLAGKPWLVPRTLGSGAVVQRKVCAECGVWICGGSRVDLSMPAEMTAIRAGTFDDTSWIKPTAHYWTRSAQPWIVFPPDAVTHETQPEMPRG